MSVRSERVASVVKTELGVYVQQRFPLEAAGMITVTEVRMTPDLRSARVYVSILGDDEHKQKALKELEDEKPAMRTAVGRAVRLRFTPEIVFILDETMDKAMKLEKLFKRIHDEERQRPHRTDDDTA